MKVRDTSRGRMYAVSSGIGCTAINGAMAVDIPAGGQSVILALDKKLIIDGDDNAKFVEVRWGTNAAIGSRPAPSWMGDILDGLVSIVGVDKFDVNYIPAENKLYLQFSLDVTTEQIEEVKSLCARVLPSNVVTEMEWADGLPMTYTRLDFLESTGWQYIDTGFTSATVGEIVLDAQDTRDTNNGYAGAGTNWDSSDSFYIRHAAHQNLIWFVVGGRIQTFGEAHFTRNKICFSKTRAVVNGREIALNADTFVPSSVPFFLFKGGNTYNSYARIFSAQLYDTSNQLVRDFIPVLDHTGRPCMFDTVTHESFYNNGAGQFIVGMTWEQVRELRLPAGGGQLTLSLPYEASLDGLAQDALERARANGWELTLQYAEAEVPAGYSKLDFLEATGTQYIDTDITLEKFGKAVHDIQFTGGSNKYMGFRAEDFSFATGLAFGISPQDRLWYGGVGTYEQPGLFNRDLWTLSVSEGVAQLSVGDNFQQKKTLPSTNAVTIYSVFSGLSQVEGIMAKMYTVNIHDSNNSLQLAYIPCLDPEGVPCMFDLVTRQPFRNNGTGQFIAGMTLDQVRSLSLPAGGGQLTLSLPYEASIDRLAQTALEQARSNGWELTLQYADSDVPAGYRKLDFLESTGTQYINTGIKADAGISAACVYYQSPEVLESATGPQYIFGCGVDTGSFAFLGLHTSAPSTLFYYKSTLTLRAERPAGKIACLCDATGMELNGTRYEFSSTAELTESFDNCKLFARGDGKFAVWANAKAQVYSFSISRAGELQVDYVPCITPEGKLGMYNKVDGSFHENKGSGAFIAGLATVDDVRNLWLPETNGELTVSVPADTPDSAVAQLRANNPTWQIAIQFRTDNEN